MSTNLQRPTGDTLKTETDYYNSMRKEFMEKHPDKWLLIYGPKLISTHISIEAATREGYRLFGQTPFLVRLSGAKQLKFTSFSLHLVP